jgi:alanine racemase
VPLEQAGAILTIDLGALRRNFRRLAARLRSHAACAAVVKADGYGLGADRVAQALRDEGCETFFVAHVCEAIALRKALGAGASLFVLNGLPPGAEGAAAAAGLVPVCNSLEQLEAWRAEAGRRGVSLPVAVQVDSGMTRLGMSPGEVERLAAEPERLAGLDLRLVMSHLACADEPAHPANESQLRAFAALRRKLPPAPASLANSSGIFLGEKFHFDLARPGAALYGVNPRPGEPNPIEAVIGLSARVIQTREVAAGTGIGYGHALLAATPLRTATISIGYADGWPRRAAAAAYLGDLKLPFAGRVSMDSIILDVSALEPGRLRPGDLVELIGPHQGVDDVAALSGTIGYEILTGLGRRFHCRYLD